MVIDVGTLTTTTVDLLVTDDKSIFLRFTGVCLRFRVTYLMFIGARLMFVDD